MFGFGAILITLLDCITLALKYSFRPNRTLPQATTNSASHGPPASRLTCLRSGITCLRSGNGTLNFYQWCWRQFADRVRLLEKYLDGRMGACWEEIENRPILSDADFYLLHYQDTDVSRDTCVGVRRIICQQLKLCNTLPSDKLEMLFPDIDIADVCYEIAEEFWITFNKAQIHELTGTVDSLIRMTQRTIDGRSS